MTELAAQGGMDDPRLIAGRAHNEDAAVTLFPQGKALVQTVDFFTPVVDDPYRFGRIAAVNALSDIYAMGAVPHSALNIVCYPIKRLGREILREILRGGLDAVREAGAMLVGGHSVQDEEIKYGLSVSGWVEPEGFAANDGLKPGDALILTKPVGSGVLATAVKGRWEGHEGHEDELYRWAGRLNAVGGRVVRDLGLRAATDVTGFGLVGHVLEMAMASKVDVEIKVEAVPFMSGARELAGMGLLPEGSHANRAHVGDRAIVLRPELDPVAVDLVFDAQTSGGLVLAVPGPLVERARTMLLDGGDLAAVIGRAVAPREGGCPGRAFLR